MTGGWQISAGDVSEFLRPAFYLLSVLASAWVFASARRRAFSPFAVWSWAAATFILPAVAFPLYLVARMFTSRESTTEEDESTPNEETELKDGESAGEEDEQQVAAPLRRRLLPPLLYAAALLLAGGIYFYQDYQSFDAHLARAARAKLNGRRAQTLSEYRAALRVREDAHTRKLLGLELLDEGLAGEAVSELRAAGAGGEPDEKLAYHTGLALDAAGRRDEAESFYLSFLRGDLCARTPPDAACMNARARVTRSEGTSAP